MFRSARIRWLVLGGALLATAVASVWPQGDDRSAPEVVAPVTRRDAPAGRELKPPGEIELPRLGAQLARPAASAKVQDLFGTSDWNPPPARDRQQQLPPAAPVAPQFPYSVAGSVADSSGPMIVFNRQNQDFALRVGEVLEQTYRIEAIDSNSVTVLYLPLGLTQVVSIER
jgi:hypothetical protein